MINNKKVVNIIGINKLWFAIADESKLGKVGIIFKYFDMRNNEIRGVIIRLIKRRCFLISFFSKKICNPIAERTDRPKVKR